MFVQTRVGGAGPPLSPESVAHLLRLAEAKTGDERLAKDALVSIMTEEKPNQKEQFKIPKEKISRFFAPGTPTQKIEDTIVKALELYRKRQRSLER